MKVQDDEIARNDGRGAAAKAYAIRGDGQLLGPDLFRIEVIRGQSVGTEISEHQFAVRGGSSRGRIADLVVVLEFLNRSFAFPQEAAARSVEAEREEFS